MMNNLESKKILVVDDDHICIEITKDILEPYGMDVHFALNGREALYAINQNAFDIILLDYEMPIMNGLEFLKHVSKLNDQTVPPIVMFSGSCNGDLEQLAKDFGARDFLFKPFEGDDLVKMIHSHCKLS